MKISKVVTLAALPFAVVCNPAQADWLDFAKTVTSDVLQGKAARAVSAKPVGTVDDSWGETSGHHYPPTSTRAAVKDERFVDERFPSATPAPAKGPESSNRAVRNKHDSSDNKPQRASSASSAPTGNSATCFNVARAWEGASNLAFAGQEDKAYGAYLKLLSSCRDARELTGTVYQAQKNLSLDALLQLLDEPVMASDALSTPAYQLRSSLLFKANKSKDLQLSSELFAQLKDQAIERGDADMLSMGGYLALNRQEYSPAASNFRAALAADRHHEKAREGLALVYLAAGKPDAAWREADRLLSDSADTLKGSIRIEQARLAYQDEDFKEAHALLVAAEKLGADMSDSDLALKAWTLNKLGQSDKASALFRKLNRADPENEEYAQGLVLASRESGDFSKIEKLAKSDSAAGAIAKDAIADQYAAQGRVREAAALRGDSLSELNAPVVSLALGAKSKSGDVGEGKQTVTVMPQGQFSIPVTENTRVVGAAGNIRMSDGIRSVAAKEAQIGFETEGQTAVRGALLMSTTLGSTKIGFDGAVRRYHAHGFAEVSVLRAPLYDSVRAYAGVPIDGVKTGRVMATSVTFAANQSVSAHWKLDYSLQLGSVEGQNVNNNGFFMAKLGGSRNLTDHGLPWLTLGPQAHVGGYREDQNVFKSADGVVLGSGGYFSPKSDTGMGVKAFISSTEGSRFLVKGSAYAGYTNRTLSDYTDSGLQLEGDISASYLLHENVIVSAGTTLRTSPGYTDSALYMALTVPLQARTALYASDIVRPSLGLK